MSYRKIRPELLLLILLLSNCQNQQKASLFLQVEHLVGGQPLVFEQNKYPTAAGHDYRVFRLKYYLSNFRLTSADGSEKVIDLVQFCDAQNPSTLVIPLGILPEGTYTGLSFIIGLDENKNKAGGLENTLENLQMEWPIPGELGYHYMKLEGKYDSLRTGVVKNFNLHTGATQNHQNYVSIRLDLPNLKIGSKVDTIFLEMDIEEWLHHPIDYDFDKFGQGIMSNQAAQEILQQNGADVFKVTAIK